MVIRFNELRSWLVGISILVIGTPGLPKCSHKGSGNWRSSTLGQSGLNDPQRAPSARDFLLVLQATLRDGDRSRTIGLIRFPVRVGEGESRTDMDESTFAQQYDKVWNPQTVKAVMDENPKHFERSPGALFEHVGCGEVWFSRMKDGQFRITGFDISAYRNAGISLPDCYRAWDFVRQLQVAVSGDHREQVVGMFKYPLVFHGQRKKVTLHNATEALHEYDLVFSSRLCHSIADQQVSNLLSQAEGVAIGDGFIWMNNSSEGGPFKVISIFEPPLGD